MANRREASTAIAIGALTLILAGVGLMYAFGPRQKPRPAQSFPVAPEHGPIVYEMQSVRSGSNRIRLAWREVVGATGYRVTLLTADDEPIDTSPDLEHTAWVIPERVASTLAPRAVYHWQLTVLKPGGEERSDFAAFTTQ